MKMVREPMSAAMMMVLWAMLGIRCENCKGSHDDAIIWISVPSYSYRHDAEGNCLCGMHLAKVFKETIKLFSRNPTVKVRIREETWTPQMSEVIRKLMVKQFFGKGRA